MKNSKNEKSQKAFLPMQDPLLPQIYAAVIAAHGPTCRLSYDELVEEAVRALAAFRKAEAE